jgi:hypothetical protein
MTEQAPANSLLVEQGLALNDGIGPSRPHDAVDLASSLIATATTQTAIPSASRGAVGAARSVEGGHVRVLGNKASFEDETARAFIEDCARNLEGLLSDRQLRETWSLDDDELARLADNAPLLDAIKAERERRIRAGDAAREAAQRHFAQAPSVLNEILHDKTISPRHRIEATKELRQVAGSGAGASGDRGERFIISINLGEDHKLLKEFDAPPRAPQDREAQ